MFESANFPSPPELYQNPPSPLPSPPDQYPPQSLTEEEATLREVTADTTIGSASAYEDQTEEALNTSSAECTVIEINTSDDMHDQDDGRGGVQDMGASLQECSQEEQHPPHQTLQSRQSYKITNIFSSY